MATFSVGFMKPNEVVKISPWPVLASWRMTRSASGPSGTLSTKLVVDLARERRLDLEPAHVVAVGPAIVAGRADVDEADLERLLREARAGAGGEAQPGGGAGEHEAPAPQVERHPLVLPLLERLGQVAGRKGLPRQAGASSRPRTEPAEMIVSTRMVAR